MHKDRNRYYITDEEMKRQEERRERNRLNKQNRDRKKAGLAEIELKPKKVGGMKQSRLFDAKEIYGSIR